MSKQSPLSVQLLNEQNKNAALQTEIYLLKTKVEDLEKKIITEKTTSNTHYQNSQNLTRLCAWLVTR